MSHDNLMNFYRTVISIVIITFTLLLCIFQLVELLILYSLLLRQNQLLVQLDLLLKHDL